MKKPPRDEGGYRRFVAYLGETGLLEEIRSICLRHAVSLRDIYFNSSASEIQAARSEIWWWLEAKHNKSRATIGRMFDRDASTISTAIKKLSGIAAEMGKELNDSAVFDLATLLAKRSIELRERMGREHHERMAARNRKLSSNGGS